MLLLNGSAARGHSVKPFIIVLCFSCILAMINKNEYSDNSWTIFYRSSKIDTMTILINTLLITDFTLKWLFITVGKNMHIMLHLLMLIVISL